MSYLRIPFRRLGSAPASSFLPPHREPFQYKLHYNLERATYPADCPDNFNFARDVIEKWADHEQRYGKPNLALWWTDDTGDERKFSFSEVVGETKKLANGLQQVAGLRKGDRVIVILPKLYQWWMLSSAMIRSGIVVCPGTLMLSARDIQHRIELAGASCVITDEDRAGKVEEALASIKKDECTVRQKIIVPISRDRVSRRGWLSYDDLLKKEISCEHECIDSKASESMLIYFTSGTTGLPKMVSMPHSYSLGHVTSSRYLLQAKPGDLCWSFSDPGWVKILYMQFFGPWLGGASIFAWNNTINPQAKDMLNVLKKYPINTFCGAPTLYRMFMLEKLPTANEVPHLRNCMSAGEPNNPDVIERWRNSTGVHIREGYGQTETSMVSCVMPGMPHKPFSMGRPTPGYDVRIIDDDLNEVPRTHEGHLAIKVKGGSKRPLGLFKEYIDAPEAMAKSFRGDYYLTGDKAYMDDDGFCFFVGRADDVMISAGYRIGPNEVESALIEHPAVTESAAVSSPDEVKGEVVKAFIVLKPEYNSADKDLLAKELQDYVKEVTAPYKYPRKIEFVDSLPKTVSGKIRRIELRQKEWANHSRPRI